MLKLVFKKLCKGLRCIWMAVIKMSLMFIILALKKCVS